MKESARVKGRKKERQKQFCGDLETPDSTIKKASLSTSGLRENYPLTEWYRRVYDPKVCSSTTTSDGYGLKYNKNIFKKIQNLHKQNQIYSRVILQ